MSSAAFYKSHWCLYSVETVEEMSTSPITMRFKGTTLDGVT